MQFSHRFIILVLVLAAIVPLVNSDENVPGNCTTEEIQGIRNCASAGSGFTSDQNKAKRCPQSYTDVDSWTDDFWQCHMYCSNPTRSDERKGCTNCDAVEVSESCFDAQREACLEFQESSTMETTVDCDAATRFSLVGVALLASILMIIL